MKPGKLSVGQLLEEVWTRSEESQVLVPYPSKLPELISKFLLCSKLSSLQNEGIGLNDFLRSPVALPFSFQNLEENVSQDSCLLGKYFLNPGEEDWHYF